MDALEDVLRVIASLNQAGVEYAVVPYGPINLTPLPFVQPLT
jgi:hypothetical protein